MQVLVCSLAIPASSDPPWLRDHRTPSPPPGSLQPCLQHFSHMPPDDSLRGDRALTCPNPVRHLRWSQPIAVVDVSKLPPGRSVAVSIPFQLSTPQNYLKLEGVANGSTVYVSHRINVPLQDMPFPMVSVRDVWDAVWVDGWRPAGKSCAVLLFDERW